MYRRKQAGSALLIAIFIILVMTLLAASLASLQRDAAESTSYEVYASRAYFSAYSGSELAVQELLASASCDAVTPQPTLPSSDGFHGCSLTTACSTASVSGDTLYKLVSTAVCETGEMITRRQVSLGVTITSGSASCESVYFNVTGAPYNNGDVNSPIYVNGDVDVNGSVNSNGTIYATGDVEVKWNVNGDIYTGGDFTVENGSVNSNVTIYAAGDVEIKWDVNAVIYSAGNVEVTNGSVNSNGIIYAAGDVEIKRDVNGIIYAGGDVKVTNGSVNSNAVIYAAGNVEVKDNVNGTIYSGGDVTVDKSVNGSGVIYATGNVDIKNNNYGTVGTLQTSNTDFKKLTALTISEQISGQISVCLTIANSSSGGSSNSSATSGSSANIIYRLQTFN